MSVVRIKIYTSIMEQRLRSYVGGKLEDSQLSEPGGKQIIFIIRKLATFVGSTGIAN